MTETVSVKTSELTIPALRYAVAVAAEYEVRREMRKADRKTRKRCPCGCGQTISHKGFANSIALMSGCELRVRRWVRDGR